MATLSAKVKRRQGKSKESWKELANAVDKALLASPDQEVLVLVESVVNKN